MSGVVVAADGWAGGARCWRRRGAGGGGGRVSGGGGGRAGGGRAGGRWAVVEAARRGRAAVAWTPRTARHRLTAMRAACTATVFEKIWRKVRETWRSSASRICRSRSYDLIRQSSRPSSSSARVTRT